ncbi:hypothetical protein ABH945_002846 [Paraburkholderia sp. GAS333]|uniref:DUF2844 domain-containing protein n=1 Tax=Paraburkholderia sp. GAS333 TaxID=3156279 RepID=UPI003D23ADA2
MRLVKIALALTALCPLASHAMLGSAPGANTHAAAVARSLLQPAAATAAASYTVREATGSDGVTIREYVLPSNVVFAVSWQGPVRPDMTALLGSYFPNFANSNDGRPRGTGPLVRHDGDFHIESAGHAGYFFGKAYLPRLVPANVQVKDLQ